MERWNTLFWTILVSVVIIGWVGLACGWGR
jgi:hypothetical protein